MKQYITLLTLYTFLCINTNAQALKQKQLDYLSDHNISLIDSTILYRDVLKKNGKVKMLIIFTNYCAGTPHVFKSMADYKAQYGNRMEFILCSSASKRDVDGLAKVLSTYKSSEQVYFIDPAQYKEYRFDDRKKGFQFRNHICQPCQKDEIGVPYRVFFGPDNEILFYGYASRKDFDKLLADYFK